ncbi:MAG: acetyl-CoA carboxylase biotin carboxylase subunit [Candidatus Eremiobacteraeota bacterium]|nr:acetyl-CoA carboxylase biotin carboxylase subunit [Candidatus Eremiobacteraeota bacterium]
MFKKVLIANRGEIAVRVIRACRELDISTVAVYSDPDRDAAHVAAADEAYRLGPAPPAASYLNGDRLLDLAIAARCDAIHPGYGFLAENADFARRCAARGCVFVGPSAEAMDRMGDKLAARETARAADVAVVPGTMASVRRGDDIRRLASEFGYPLVIKAAAGGGGKGLKVVLDDAGVEQALSLAVKEAGAYFHDDTVYVERYLQRPKHVEVQILGDKFGHVLYLGERDCSLQRRHQKLIEETPAAIDGTLRHTLQSAACKLAAAINYDSAGTIECLVEGDRYFFLEMNTRIQVEHTITEMTWGVDLVKAQIRIAAGEALWMSQDELSSRGHAIECRINAESPAHEFRPSAGTITHYRAAGGPGVRVDSAAFAGATIPPDYDSLISKLCVWGENRQEARQRMLRALDESVVTGVETTIPFSRWLLEQPAFVSGHYDTSTVEELVRARSGAVAAAFAETPDAALQAPRSGDGAGPEPLTVEVDGRRFTVRVYGAQASSGPAQKANSRFKSPKKAAQSGTSVPAPMHGLVAEIRVGPGDAVVDGQVVAIIEAMKMMNEVVAHQAGIVGSVVVKLGDTVNAGASLLNFAEL